MNSSKKWTLPERDSQGDIFGAQAYERLRKQKAAIISAVVSGIFDYVWKLALFACKDLADVFREDYKKSGNRNFGSLQHRRILQRNVEFCGGVCLCA